MGVVWGEGSTERSSVGSSLGEGVKVGVNGSMAAGELVVTGTPVGLTAGLGGFVSIAEATIGRAGSGVTVTIAAGRPHAASDMTTTRSTRMWMGFMCILDLISN